MTRRYQLPDACESLRWSVAACQPSREHVAAANLANQQIRHFLPLRKKSVRRGSRILGTRGPLFPGYIFVAVGSERHLWRSVNGTYGVKHLLFTNNEPQFLPVGFVEELANLADRDGLVVGHCEIEPGDRVEFCDGPLARQIGRILACDANGRISVMLGMLSGEIRVQARREDILPA